jgi:diguanylate cyclase (GGDEF)-like protein
MERGNLDAYLAGYTKKIWWEIYVQHVFGALLLGAFVALCVAGFVFTRDRARSKYHAERRRVETDHLTGALSRVGFERALSRRAVQTAAPAIFVIDIDHFKQVNDRYGHAVGDQILCEVVSLLRQGLRDSDLLARWGGEEFILLLPLVDSEAAFAVAERFKMSVSQYKFRVDEDTNLSVTISIGISFLEDDGIGAAFAKADEALYRAKHEGRNRVCLC